MYKKNWLKRFTKCVGEQEKDEMIYLKKEGYTNSEIGRRLDFSENTVACWTDPRRKQQKTRSTAKYNKTTPRGDSSAYDKMRLKKIKNDPVLNAQYKMQNKMWARGARAKKPELRLHANIRRRVTETLGPQKVSTDSEILKFIGCTREFLIKHLMELFYPHPETGEKMSINNHGRGGWELDHKKCLQSYATEKEKVEYGWYYTNLQPLWVEDHRKKFKGDMKLITERKREAKLRQI
jgi:hypothetical protein